MMHLFGPVQLLHPLALWLLLLLPVSWLWLAQGDNGERALSRLVDASLLPHLVAGRRRRGWAPWVIVTLGLLLLVAAMAGPALRHKPQPLYTAHAAQVVAMSMSSRMLARDVTPDRLTRARYKVHALFDANRGGQNALVAYAGQAFVVAPLTSDADALSDLLDALSPNTMPTPGNNAADAIKRGVKLLDGAGIKNGSLVLVTDSANQAAVDAAKAADADGVRVSVLGVGAAGKGAPVPGEGGGFLTNSQGQIVMAKREDGQLRTLAAAGGGIYQPLTNNADDIHALAAQLRQGQAAKRAKDRASRQWIDEGPWFALALLPLLALGFRRGWLLLLCLTVAPMWPAPAQASTWQNLWQRRDQQAEQALRQGHPRQAEKLAHSPMLRGTAAYRAGHYKAAAKGLRTGRRCAGRL